MSRLDGRRAARAAAARMMPSPRRLGRGVPLLASLVYLGVLLAGTLWPFDFGAGPARHAVEWIPFTHTCRAGHGHLFAFDKALNVAIFVPVGALAALLTSRSTRLLRSVARTVAFGFALSVAIEVAQTFLPSRFPAASDVLMNTLGAAIGAGAVELARRSTRASSRALAEAGARRPDGEDTNGRGPAYSRRATGAESSSMVVLDGPIERNDSHPGDR